MYRVIIVDDEPVIRRGLRETIEWDALGLEVAGEAADGKEALKLIREIQPEILITDIRMPEMDGIELIREVKKMDLNIKITILSGYSDYDYLKAAIRLGVDNYLLKPIDEEELAAALSAMAIQAGPKQQSAPTEEKTEFDDEKTGGLAQRALSYIQQHFSDPISLTSVAEEMGVAPAYLSTVFHREIGSSYSRTLLKFRMEEAARQLIQTNRKVQEIAQNVGFFSAKHFTHVFREYYHCSPVEYRLHPPCGANV